MTKKRSNKKSQTQIELIMEFFRKKPNINIPHPKVVDWVVSEWKKRTGNVFRDPDRGIRLLYEKGYLIKVEKGIYCYKPSSVKQRNSENFSVQQKERILNRDNHKCVVCGRGKTEGVELHVDHIKPKDLGGKATMSNGQTLCSQHNFLKKNLKQTEAGKKMFIRLYEIAIREKNKSLKKFCIDILQIYENHNINGHIKWKK